jgi:hypothetical protein
MVFAVTPSAPSHHANLLRATLMKHVSLMKKRDIEVFRQALALATSGEFVDWKGIQSNLVEKGYRRAPDLLDAATIRAVLDARCRAKRHQRAAG